MGLEIEVELTPGWGGPLWVEDADTGERLVGVRVLVDGDEVGVTDEDGELQLAVPSAPERVDFELEGFEVTDRAGLVDSEGAVRPASGDPIHQYIEVKMRERG